MIDDIMRVNMASLNGKKTNEASANRSQKMCCKNKNNNMKNTKMLVWNVLVVISLMQLASLVASFHLPYGLMRSANNPLAAFGEPGYSPFASQAQRRQDDDSGADYEEMTPKASEAHQNNNNEDNGDGYGETENDGPYEETPRDQEGQADLERFFDDHLGASDKDGMDKENLPTNIIESIANMDTVQQMQSPEHQQQAASADSTALRQSEMLSYLKKRRSLLGADKTDIQEPYKTKLIIMKEVEDDGLRRRANVTIGAFPMITPTRSENDQFLDNSASFTRMPTIEPIDRVARNANVGGVRASEDEEMDKIYVTNRTDAPFKIDALGGFDPEEDFEHATQDLDGQTDKSDKNAKVASSPGDDASAAESTNQDDQEQEQSGIDGDNASSVSKFNDPEVEALFNDASETDETFAADEPDWGDDKPERDLSEERLQRRRRQRSMQLPSFHDGSSNIVAEIDDDGNYNPQAAASSSPSANDKDDDDDDEDTEPDLERRQQPRRRSDRDDDTSWVNDGVDDMEIPSKLDQERAIQKAARREAKQQREREEREGLLPDEADAEPQPSDNGQSEQQQDPTDVRMPNADYLKEDMRDLEDDANR